MITIAGIQFAESTVGTIEMVGGATEQSVTDDLAAVRAGYAPQLLAQCLVGAEGEIADDWRDYVAALCYAAGLVEPAIEFEIGDGAAPLTATVSVGGGSPSAYYPEEERRRNGATDYDVTITVGAVVVVGGITLYRGADGRMSSGDSPLDGWCSSTIVEFVSGLMPAQRRSVLASLEVRAEADDVDLEAPFSAGERVESRATGEDWDAGCILSARITGSGWRFEIGWDTGVRTTVTTGEIRAERYAARRMRRDRRGF